MKKISSIFVILLILLSNCIFAAPASTGGGAFSSGGAFSGGSAFGGGGPFSGGGDASSTSNDTSSTSSLGSGAMQQAPNGNQGQTQIIGNDNGGRDDRGTNSYRRDDYNSYQALLRAGGGNQLQLADGSIVYTSAGGSQLTPPNEFQMNVYTRTGIFLERYGYNLFRDPDTFMPNSNLPASNNYLLGPGDEVSIKAWGAIDIVYTAKIDKDGSIFIPKVGRINLTGIKASNLEGHLKEKISSIYRNFSLSATVSNISSIQINVTGFAKKPGTYMISSLSTLTNAIFASGGPSDQGTLRHILLKRHGRVIADYDMYNLLLGGNDSGDIRLLSGDIIYIRPYGRQVAIYDGVKVAGIYEAKENETIKDIVRFAGGYTFNNTKKEIIVERIVENHKIHVLTYNFDQGLAKNVENGDIVHFFRMPNRYDDAVVLIGNIANPSRFNWHEGMRIKDVIPNKEALLTKSFWDSYSKNTYVKDRMLEMSGRQKTNYWGAGKSKSAEFFSSLNSTTANRVGNVSAFGGGDNLFNAGPVSIPEADINWHYAVIVRLDPHNFQSKLIPFDLDQAIEGNPRENLQLQPGDIINILSSKDVRNPAKKGIVYVFVDGEVNRPGVYELPPGSTLHDAIKTAGSTTKDAYLYGLEFTREAVKKRQKAALMQMLDNVQQSLLSQASASTVSSINNDQVNMKNQILAQQQAFIDKMKEISPTGRVVLNLSPTDKLLSNLPNLVLENGDTVYIPTIPSTVDVIGQVYNPATFIYSPKETLDDYLNKAGTPNKFADTSSIYVLRANGTLYSRQQSGWFSAFYSQNLYAGDAIIVPQKIDFTTLTKNIIDWTQILANFGLGVAAINQLNRN